MKKHLALPLVGIIGAAAAFVLRLLYNRTAFEPDTGLPIPGNPAGFYLPGLLAALALVCVLLAQKLPGGREERAPGFSPAFACEILPRMLLVMGAFFWLVSGVWDLLGGMFFAYPYAVSADPALPSLLAQTSFSSLLLTRISGVLSVVCAACLFPVASACRRGGRLRFNGANLLIPVAGLVVRLVLTYRAVSINPVLQSYYVELLALCGLILCLYRASSFAYGDGRTRRFAVYAAMAAVLCAAALADCAGLAELLLYGGGCLVALGLLTARLDGIDEPAAAPQDAPQNGEASA